MPRLNKMLYLDTKYFLPDHNLNYTDKMSMAHGVEVRVPLLDYEVVRHAGRLRVDQKQRGPTTKWVFRKAMEGILPRDIIYRPKSGFGVPLRQWMSNALQPLVDDVLSERSVSARGIFSASGGTPADRSRSPGRDRRRISNSVARLHRALVPSVRIVISYSAVALGVIAMLLIGIRPGAWGLLRVILAVHVLGDVLFGWVWALWPTYAFMKYIDDPDRIYATLFLAAAVAVTDASYRLSRRIWGFVVARFGLAAEDGIPRPRVRQTQDSHRRFSSLVSSAS